ncbi:MAG: hypothetical protein DDT19_00224 [Syntrophomonadaceae bacterium]|nr:hypothetical protein [Bacillota bacterium]
MTRQIVVSPIDTEKVRKSNEDVAIMLQDSQRIVITTQEQNEKASAFLKVVKARYKELEEKRKAITQPLDTAKKEVQELFRRPLEMLGQAEGIIKTAILSFVQEQERKAGEEQRRLQELAEKEAEKERKRLEERAQRAEAKGKEEKAEELREQAKEVEAIAPVLAQPDIRVEGVSYRDLWRAEVVDVSLVPREYMIPNQQALDKIAQATKGVIQIAGVKFVCTKIIAVR